MVGIPSTLVRFPTTWMEIHPLGLVGPDVAVIGCLKLNVNHWRSGLMGETFKAYFPSNQEKRHGLSEARGISETSHHIS